MKSIPVWISLVLSCCTVAVLADDIYDIISRIPELDEFVYWIQENNMVQTLRYNRGTVFAPTNDAFYRYWRFMVRPENLLYHMVNVTVTSENFPDSFPSVTWGGLPIWVTMIYNPLGSGSRIEYYANQGRIIRRDIKGQSKSGAQQVLHVIDEVLFPTLPEHDDPLFNNPSAYNIITSPDPYSMDGLLSHFQHQVNLFRKNMAFQDEGGHTFFIPIQGYNMSNNWEKVDDNVIDSHIIPNKVFFTKTFPLYPQETLASANMLKVLLSIKNESNFLNNVYGTDLFIQSTTISGYSKYQRGTVVAHIVYPNMPVKNGVVHLIDRPLTIMSMDLVQLLSHNNQVRIFLDHAQRYKDIMDMLLSDNATVFVPTDKAFNAIEPTRLSKILTDKHKVKQLLDLHIVPHRYITEEIMQGLTTAIATHDRKRKLHFSNITGNVNVIGGGISATIIIPDIGATNGIMHIIDNVMGMPFHDMHELLESGNGLSSTLKLGQQSNFNSQFLDLTKRFTYFVPHNDAWNELQKEQPSESDTLFSGNYSSQVNDILNRHLIGNQSYSLTDLLSLGKVQTLEGWATITVSNNRYFIKWEDEVFEIIDPDVEASNGYVHIINGVLFNRHAFTTSTTLITQASFKLTVFLTAIFYVITRII